VPAHEVNAFFSSDGLKVDGRRLFSAVFGIAWADAVGVDEGDYDAWRRTRNQVIHGRSSTVSAELEQGSVAICEMVGCLAKWGCSQKIGYDGLTHLGSIGLPTVNTADGRLSDVLDNVKDDIQSFPSKRWAAFKSFLEEIATSS
jgi:hypothetical protein